MWFAVVTLNRLLLLRAQCLKYIKEILQMNNLGHKLLPISPPSWGLQTLALKLKDKNRFISSFRPTVHTNPSRKRRRFRKRSSNRRNLKTPAFCFRVDGKHFENETFRKQRHQDNNWSHTNPKSTLTWSLERFLVADEYIVLFTFPAIGHSECFGFGILPHFNENRRSVT